MHWKIQYARSHTGQVCAHGLWRIYHFRHPSADILMQQDLIFALSRTLTTPPPVPALSNFRFCWKRHMSGYRMFAVRCWPIEIIWRGVQNSNRLCAGICTFPKKTEVQTENFIYHINSTEGWFWIFSSLMPQSVVTHSISCLCVCLGWCDFWFPPAFNYGGTCCLRRGLVEVKKRVGLCQAIHEQHLTLLIFPNYISNKEGMCGTSLEIAFD